jgi:uncharacterized Fe-S cluster protein YjdI
MRSVWIVLWKAFDGDTTDVVYTTQSYDEAQACAYGIAHVIDLGERTKDVWTDEEGNRVSIVNNVLHG